MFIEGRMFYVENLHSSVSRLHNKRCVRVGAEGNVGEEELELFEV